MHFIFAPLLALAQDALTLSEPLPIAGQPHPATVTAFALPPQKVAYITDDALTRACEIVVTLQPDGATALAAAACPPPMIEDARAITGQWRFIADPAATGPTTLRVRYVLVYSAALGTTTLHAEIDPGADHLDIEGSPGLKLVHPATLAAPLEAKLPKSAAKAGLGPTECKLKATVDARGKVAATAVVACPEALLKDASKRVRGAKFSPYAVDGNASATEVEVSVRYTAR